MPLSALNWSWWGAVLLFAGIVFSEAGGVELSQASDDEEEGGRYVVSVATIPHIAGILLLPPPIAALLAGAGCWWMSCADEVPCSVWCSTLLAPC